MTAQNSKWNVLEALEKLSKATAVCFFAVYVLGFMIVSLHNASFGFSELNPLKPKILSAGVLFVFMTLLPIALAKAAYSHGLELTPEQSFSRAIVATLTYYVECVVVSFLLAPLCLFRTSSSGSVTPQVTLTTPQIWAGVLTLLGAVTLARYALDRAYERFQSHPMLTALLAGVIVFVGVVAVLFGAGMHGIWAVTTWLFSVGVLSATINHAARDPEKRKQLGLQPLMLAIIAVAGFSSWIYPQFRPEWGGGAPIPVVLYFNRDSRILPSR